MAKTLSIGKLRALQRASDSEGRFTILAIDHQDALRQALNPDAPNSIPDEEMIAFKSQTVRHLLPAVGGLLLDPVYGAAQMIAEGLPKDIGLLLELEKADYEMQPLPREVEIRPNWSVSKIKRMGGDGVKLFYYYDPDDSDLCAKQDATFEAVVADCAVYDIPFYAEPILLNTTPQNRTTKIIQAALRAQELGADILKLEFPVDVKTQSSETWADACSKLSDALEIPWVLLSAGVDFETFCQQLEVACQSGASGCIAGRAVWGDACPLTHSHERDMWLHDTGLPRMQRLKDIITEHAASWTECYMPPPVSTTWFADYPSIEA